MRFVDALRDLAGGWKLVDYALSSRPPATTEQVLHPQKYIHDELPSQVTIRAAALRGRPRGPGERRSRLHPHLRPGGTARAGLGPGAAPALTWDDPAVSLARTLLGAFWVFAGTMHFIRRHEYEATVPDYVPLSSEDAVEWSGYAEIAGGLAVLMATTRRLGRWWLLGVLVAVFPANVHMALDPAAVAERGVPIDRIPRWLLWARLPLQPLFMLWAWRATE